MNTYYQKIGCTYQPEIVFYWLENASTSKIFLLKEIFRNLFKAEKNSERIVAACYATMPSTSLVGRISHDCKGKAWINSV